TPSNAPCTYSLGSSGLSALPGGGPGSVSLTTASDCLWTATSNTGWVTLSPGSTSGTGPATIQFTVSANNGAPRTGVLSVAGQTYTVNQASPCSYSISPSSQNFSHPGGTGAISVSSTTGCPWTAVSNDSFITITSGSSGSGNGTVDYSVA